MALMMNGETEKEFEETIKQKPGVQIFLQPIAPPAALGLAGFAGSTFITAVRLHDLHLITDFFDLC